MTIKIIEAETWPDDLPPGSICRSTLWSDNWVDCFFGRKADLIASGIVEAGQFPPDGVRGISWAQGQQVRRNCRKDETYRRLDIREADIWRVAVGLHREVAAARKKAETDKRQAERIAKAEKERAAALRKAQGSLEEFPRSEREYRMELIRRTRTMVQCVLFEAPFKPSDWHGYTVAEDAAADIVLSFDAIAEAIMRADVKCDHAKQAQIVSRLQAAVVAAGGGEVDKVAALTRPNPALLQGEAS